MKPHQQLDQDDLERIALFALGVLPQEEAEAFRDHSRKCALCREESAALEPVVAGLGELAPDADPPAALKDRLFGELGLQNPERHKRAAEAGPERDASAPTVEAGRVHVRSDDLDWEAANIPGVFRKMLHVDRDRKSCAMLVRMEPGTRYPAHFHVGPEEIFVLEGDFRDEFGALVKGDYQRVEANTRHGWQYTERGCLLLVRSSPLDRVL